MAILASIFISHGLFLFHVYEVTILNACRPETLDSHVGSNSSASIHAACTHKNLVNWKKKFKYLWQNNGGLEFLDLARGLKLTVLLEHKQLGLIFGFGPKAQINSLARA